MFIDTALLTRSMPVCMVTRVQRFQKAYEALEHEATLERKKLMAEHQQRIQDELARKKTDAMNDYLEALAEDQPQVSSVGVNSLHNYCATSTTTTTTVNTTIFCHPTNQQCPKQLRDELQLCCTEKTQKNWTKI